MTDTTLLEMDSAAASMSQLMQATDDLPTLQDGLLQPAVPPSAADTAADVAMDQAAEEGGAVEEDLDGGEPPVTSSHGKVAPFVAKLWDVMNDAHVRDIVAWDGDDAFAVLHAERFLRDVLPRLCRSVSFCAFVRQLNGYGFAKTGVKRASFRHRDALFQRDRPDLLPSIVRQGTGNKRRHDSSSPGPAARGRVRKADTVEVVPARGRSSGRRSGSKGATGATLADINVATAALYDAKPRIVRGPRAPAPPAAAEAHPTGMGTPPAPVETGAELARMRAVALAAIAALREISLGTADAASWSNGTARAVVDMSVSNLIRKAEVELNRTFVQPPTSGLSSAARLDAALRQLSAATATSVAVEQGSDSSVGTRRSRTDSDWMAPAHTPAALDHSSDTSSISAYTHAAEAESKDAKLAELLGSGFSLAVDGPPSAAAMQAHAAWAPPPSSFDAAMASFSAANAEFLRPGGTYGDRFVPFSSSDMDAILRMLVAAPSASLGGAPTNAPPS